MRSLSDRLSDPAPFASPASAMRSMTWLRKPPIARIASKRADAGWMAAVAGGSACASAGAASGAALGAGASGATSAFGAEAASAGTSFAPSDGPSIAFGAAGAIAGRAPRLAAE
jgi:hypothetical protein